MILLTQACTELVAQIRTAIDASQKTSGPLVSVSLRRVARLPLRWSGTTAKTKDAATGHGAMAFEKAKKDMVGGAEKFFAALTDSNQSPFAAIRAKVTHTPSDGTTIQFWGDGLEFTTKAEAFPQHFASICQKLTVLGGAKPGGVSPAYVVQTSGDFSSSRAIFVRAIDPSRAMLAAMGVFPYVAGENSAARRDVQSVRLLEPDPYRLHAQALESVRTVTNSAELWGWPSSNALVDAYPKGTAAPARRSRAKAA